MLKSEMRWATSVVFAEYKETKGEGKMLCASNCCSIDCSADDNAVGACFRRIAHWKFRVWLSFTLMSCNWDRVREGCIVVLVVKVVSTTGSGKDSSLEDIKGKSLDWPGKLVIEELCDSVESESIICAGEIGEKCTDVESESDFLSCAASVANCAMSWEWHELRAL